jgi:hypothetical protein
MAPVFIALSAPTLARKRGEGCDGMMCSRKVRPRRDLRGCFF